MVCHWQDVLVLAFTGAGSTGLCRAVLLNASCRPSTECCRHTGSVNCRAWWKLRPPAASVPGVHQGHRHGASAPGTQRCCSRSRAQSAAASRDRRRAGAALCDSPVSHRPLLTGAVHSACTAVPAMWLPARACCLLQGSGDPWAGGHFSPDKVQECKGLPVPTATGRILSLGSTRWASFDRCSSYSCIHGSIRTASACWYVCQKMHGHAAVPQRTRLSSAACACVCTFGGSAIFEHAADCSHGAEQPAPRHWMCCQQTAA